VSFAINTDGLFVRLLLLGHKRILDFRFGISDLGKERNGAPQ
jgi:hypothetical protein